MIDPDAAERLMAWHAQALCHPDHGHDPALWFPVVTNVNKESRKEAVAEAISICRACPVRRTCLKSARENGEQYGVWGGFDFQANTPAPSKPRQPTVITGDRGRPGKPRKKPPINHGTAGGYKAHRRRGETPCEPCVLAMRAYDQGRKLKRREAS